jgi:hypothetical protein
VPQVGWTIGGKTYTFEQAFAFAKSGESPVPLVMLQALHPDRNDFYPSASVISGCLRKFELQKEVEYFPTVASHMRLANGTASHTMWEGQDTPPGVLTDTVRLSAVLDLGIESLSDKYRYIELNGRPDYLDPTGITYSPSIGTFIRDWKSKDYVPVAGKFYPPPENRIQANIYNWLWVKQGHPPLDFWELIYYDRQGEPKTFRAPLRPVQYTEDWLVTTLTPWAVKAAAGGIMPPIKDFYMRDKQGRLTGGLCKYCEVRDVCEIRHLAEGGSLTTEKEENANGN